MPEMRPVPMPPRPQPKGVAIPSQEGLIRKRHADWATAAGTFGDHLLSHPDEECWGDLDRHALLGFLDAARTPAPPADPEALREAERAAMEALRERDELIERLDALAYAIAPMDLIGEHSNRNDPWANALEIIENAPREALDAVVAGTYAVPHAAAPATDDDGRPPLPAETVAYDKGVMAGYLAAKTDYSPGGMYAAAAPAIDRDVQADAFALGHAEGFAAALDAIRVHVSPLRLTGTWEERKRQVLAILAALAASPDPR